VVLEPGVARKLKAALALVVKQGRKGLALDQGVLRQCCQMLLDLDMERSVYEDVFEHQFLQKTREYYTVQ